MHNIGLVVRSGPLTIDVIKERFLVNDNLGNSLVFLPSPYDGPDNATGRVLFANKTSANPRGIVSSGESAKNLMV